MDDQKKWKDYRIKMKGTSKDFPKDANDYRNRESEIPDPDECCVEEYKDFKRLINSNNHDHNHEGILIPDCNLILKTSEDAIRVTGDHLVHAWVRYLNPARKSMRTDWSFVEACVSTLPPNLFEEFLDCMWSPGNYIFWKTGRCSYKRQKYCVCDLRCMEPYKRACSTINQAKGLSVLDRPDYTFESIRRWFMNLELPEKVKDSSKGLNNVLERPGNDLRDLFGDWAGFVKYFRLKGSFVTDEGRVIDLSATQPPNDTKTDWSKKSIVVFDDNFTFLGYRPGERREGISDEELSKEYETYLRNSICAITNRNKELEEI